MRNLTLVLTWVALAGAVAAGVLFFLIGNSKQRLQQQLVAAENRGTQLAADFAQAEADKANLADRIQSLDTQLAATKRELTATKLDLEQQQRALELLEAQHTASEAAAAQAQTELAAARTELREAHDQLATALPAADAIRYRQTITQLEDRILELEELVRHAPPQLVSSRGDHAQVVSVGPQNAFVVINFGKNHGAVTNQRLRITRGSDLLAWVEISDTRENYSVAQVLPESLSGILRKGDAATLTP